jgi:carbon storage regulator
MLILTRNTGESIIIGNGKNKIVITITAIRKGQVNIGIDAPKEIPIVREEIYEKAEI